MAVTLKELAAACGMSVSTVSKALNGYPDVSAVTKQQVSEIAARMGYRPNAIARSLKIGRTYNIGVVYVDRTESGFTHNYFSPILQAFKQEIEAHGYDLTFISHRHHGTTMTYMEHCLARNVDGVCIVCCDDFSDPEIQQLLSSKMPSITVDFPYPGGLSVCSDNRAGMAELVQYIIDQGHRRIAFIHGEKAAVTQHRIEIFKKLLAASNISLPDEYLVESKYHNPAAVREATTALLRLPVPPTCIIMPDDYSSLGGREAIQSIGLTVPNDVSIAGYDGVTLLQLCTPSLTTYKQDSNAIGHEAGLRMIDRIENPGKPFPGIVSVSGIMLHGETVAKIES